MALPGGHVAVMARTRFPATTLKTAELNHPRRVGQASHRQQVQTILHKITDFRIPGPSPPSFRSRGPE